MGSEDVLEVGKFRFRYNEVVEENPQTNGEREEKERRNGDNHHSGQLAVPNMQTEINSAKAKSVAQNTCCYRG